MTRHYLTLSDMVYLPKLLAMHESLLRHSTEDFKLHVLTMDTEIHWMLYEFQLSNIELYPLSNFEVAMNLQPQKKARTWQEFCWTCSSNFMEFAMCWIGDCTYLDADLYFFSDPKVIFEEIGERSLGITPHRFPSHRKHMEKNGRYNVGLVHAKNTEPGKRCIAQWAKNCRDWCFNRVEEHHACGDQLYLDSWEADYPGEVASIQNIGVNLAPWNIERWAITKGPMVGGVPVVFYHLHEYLNPDNLTKYVLREEDLDHIYRPYNEAWNAANVRIIELEDRAAEQRRLIEMEAQRA